MSKTNTERRVAKMARQTAKVVCQLRRDGHIEAAQKLEAAAENIRAGLV